MISIDFIRKTALSFPGTSQETLFEKILFKVGQKIFAIYDTKENKVYVRLPTADQEIFFLFRKEVFSPAPGKWDSPGWTNINLEKAGTDMLRAVLTMACYEID